jgi:UDP-GlcNAc:undecaprenyl-phosphate GlcNAc-1-phosphate transferase
MMLFACLIAIAASAAALVILRALAPPLGLVDNPDERKCHSGSVPLVGGLAMFLGVFAGSIAYGRFHTFGHVLLATSAVLVLKGALDDCHNLSVYIRLLAQTIMILVMIAATGTYIHTLGHLFGHQVVLGQLGIPLTVVAVIGLLNAFNMMDGIDGLAGGLALVAIAAITAFVGLKPLRATLALVLLLGAAMLPYLLANLGLLGRKVFMGDAGSILVGYLLAWTLIRLSQLPQAHLSPVDVLWCVALPVLDTFAVMYRRMRQGKSPFKPDRGHIHHILLRAGLSSRATLVALIALAASIAFLGTVARSLGTGAGSNLTAFLVFAVFYIFMVTRIWARQETRHAKTSTATRQHANLTSPMHHQRSHDLKQVTRRTGTDDVEGTSD